MADIISAEKLKSLKAGEYISGICLIKTQTEKLTKTGKGYIDGTFMSGVTVPFKAWSESEAYASMKESDYSEVATLINGKVMEFNGQVYINLDNITAVEVESNMVFFEQRYNTYAYTQALVNLTQSLLTSEGFELANTMLFNDDKLWKRFTEEFAAQGYHDNCISGLLAHTFKVCSLLNYTLQSYPTLCNLLSISGELDEQKQKDILYLGALLHDIGKTMEMHFGVYQPESCVTHRILGLDILYAHRDKIEAIYGLYGFRMLQSIIVEHHGEHGDACRTVVAYMINLVDEFDTKCTNILQAFDAKTTGSTGCSIKIDGSYLSY